MKLDCSLTSLAIHRRKILASPSCFLCWCYYVVCLSPHWPIETAVYTLCIDFFVHALHAGWRLEEKRIVFCLRHVVINES